MGLLSLLNVSCNAQIQYWGEDTYDLENVKFGINVDKYYSKAVDIKKKWKPSEKFDHSMRYYSKDTIECITKDGRKDTIYEYGSFETTHSDVLARFGDFKFPYTGMVADKRGNDRYHSPWIFEEYCRSGFFVAFFSCEIRLHVFVYKVSS